MLGQQSIAVCFFLAAILVLRMNTNAAPTEEAASHPEEDSDRCLFACPYNFDPVCGENGQDTLMFANSCFMDRFNCEQRQDYKVVGGERCMQSEFVDT